MNRITCLVIGFILALGAVPTQSASVKVQTETPETMLLSPSRDLSFIYALGLWRTTLTGTITCAKVAMVRIGLRMMGLDNAQKLVTAFEIAMLVRALYNEIIHYASQEGIDYLNSFTELEQVAFITGSATTGALWAKTIFFDRTVSPTVQPVALGLLAPALVPAVKMVYLLLRKNSNDTGQGTLHND